MFVQFLVLFSCSGRDNFFWSAIVLTILAVVVLPQSVRAEESEPPPIFDTDAHDNAIDALLQQGKSQYNSGVQPSRESPNDDSIRLSNSADASAEAHAYAEDDKCDGHTMHTVTLPDETESSPFVCAHVTRKGNGDTAGQPPTTREILDYAATTIHADGAGLHKRPEGVSYTNKYIPTLVAATHPTQTHTVMLLGHDITITLTATNYTWSWGDGTPDVTTTGPGMPWQARRHGPQHRPEVDPPLLHPTPGVAVYARWPIPPRRPRNHVDHHVERNRHQPLHRRNTNHQRPRHRHGNNRQIPPVPPSHQQHRHLGRKTRPLVTG